MKAHEPVLKPVPDPGEGDLAAARRVLALASEALAALAGGLDGSFSAALDILEKAKGRVIVSGMGKSGHVARKTAATLSSTGTPAYFVHPAEASHGDMGVITADDVLLLLSKGGETEELANLLTYAKRFHIPMIAIAARGDSTLARAAEVALLLPDAPESCAIGMAPTTSTTMMIALGDALAVALMERRGFGAERYRDFHPGGSLGRALIRVRDLMHGADELPLVAPGAPMRDVIVKMTSGGKGFAGVVGVVDAQGALAGIITDGDVRRHVERDLLDRKASEVMTAGPRTVAPDMLAAEALNLMNTGTPKVTSLFVVEGSRPVGILTVHDCLRAGVA
jgi:arabinose-5-phosphate isomerase